MTPMTARWIGGFGALALGLVALDLQPPLGLLETVAAGVVLLTRRPGTALVAVVPTCLLLASAVVVMVTVSGPDNPVMWPIAVVAALTAVVLIRGGAVARAAT